MKYKYLTSINRVPNKPHFRRPIVDVELFGPKGSIPTIALLDSGADFSLFNIEYAKTIGVDIPVGFIDSRSVTGLIGQTGFFDLHRIKFERDHNSFETSPVK